MGDWVESGNAKSLGAKPKSTGGVLLDGVDGDVSEGRDLGPCVCCFLEDAVGEAGLSADPDAAVFVGEHLVDQIAGEAALAGECFEVFVTSPSNEAASGETDPNGPFTVLEDGIDGAVQALVNANSVPAAAVVYDEAVA